MKKLILTVAILFSCLIFKNAQAQIGISLGVNIGSQPDWGPVGYAHANYYYLPDVDGYYDVNAHQYIYQENNVWVHRGYLPARFRNYDLYHGYKVVINDRDPWLHHDIYRARYAAFRGRHDQGIIRDSHDARYKNHWRDVHQDQRAQHLDQKAHHEDQRAHSENQRAQQEDQRAHHEDQRAKQLNQKEHKLDKKAKDDKDDNNPHNN